MFASIVCCLSRCTVSLIPVCPVSAPCIRKSRSTNRKINGSVSANNFYAHENWKISMPIFSHTQQPSQASIRISTFFRFLSHAVWTGPRNIWKHSKSFCGQIILNWIAQKHSDLERNLVEQIKPIGICLVGYLVPLFGLPIMVYQ